MLDGAMAEEQFPSDLAVGSASRDKSYDVELAAGESAVPGLGSSEPPEASFGLCTEGLQVVGYALRQRSRPEPPCDPMRRN